MKKNKILIANSQPIFQEGIRSILNKVDSYDIVTYANSKRELFDFLKKNTPSILIIDPINLNDFSIANLQTICEIFPASRILVIADTDNENTLKILELGITHFISKFCSKEELIYSISAIENNENYLSKNIVDILLQKNQIKKTVIEQKIQLTKKESEIVQLLAQGLSTKKIAEKESLSIHTINTHRKNILKKLNLKNTSELIMYAVKTGIVDTTEYYI